MKPFLAASAAPAGQLLAVGAPTASQMRTSMSTSLEPGKRHETRNISAKMHPTAQMSMGDEYMVADSSSSGARYQRVAT